MEEQGLDPWLLTNESDNHFTTPFVFDDDFKPFTKMPDSNAYITSLEKKLMCIKGNLKKLTGSSMVNAIEKSKEDHMSNLLQGFTTTTQCLEDSGNFIPNSTLQSIIKSKFYPEKLALSAEELQSLLSADQLSLLSQITEVQQEQ